MVSAFGLYTHIRRNRIVSNLLLAGLFVLVLVVAYAATLVAVALMAPSGATFLSILRRSLAVFPYVAPLAVLATALWILFALSAQEWLIDRVTGARPVSRIDEPRLHALAEALCISRGMSVPALKVLESGALNAFASGLDERRMSVTVTRGLLDALDERELEAVLAHELTHIRNDDVRLMVIAVLVAGVASFFGEVIFRVITSTSSRDRGSGGGWSSGSGSSSSSSSGGSKDSGKGAGGALLAIALAIALIMLAWALSQVIRFALSRSREFLADAGAVELTKNPDALISALLKIEGRGEIEGVPSGVMEMCVDNPRNGVVDLFATHPPIADRVEALRRWAGGRAQAA